MPTAGSVHVSEGSRAQLVPPLCTWGGACRRSLCQRTIKTVFRERGSGRFVENSTPTAKGLWYNTSMRLSTVTEVTRRVKTLIDSDESLADLWIEAEVSNFQRASSGHCYFTLRDSACEIRCVMWRNLANQLSWLPAQGDLAEGHGYVSVYERGGPYQFYVDTLNRGGTGALWQQFVELKARLEAEGLYDTARKRAVPKWPRRVGVVTSPTGAALRDILNVLRLRYPLVEVVLSPSLVQGQDAPQSLVRALDLLARCPGIDVVIVARGGGSIEDLWAFNDERVARAIASSMAPVVTGIGHETDFTICDFVADLRAPTPSAAAAAVVPDAAELMHKVLGMSEALGGLITSRLEHLRNELRQQERLLQVHAPGKLIAENRQRVDDLLQRAKGSVSHRVALLRTRLEGHAAQLQALDPRLVMRRGYAIVQDRASNMRIQSVKQARTYQEIRVHIVDGYLDAQVTEIVTP